LQDDFPRHYTLFATRTATYKDETFRNHNTMLLHYEGTDGIKTGYTRASGFNLVASVRRGKKHVIGAVFGGASAASRNTAMRTFLNMGLVKASTEVTRQRAAPLIAQAPAPAPDKRTAQAPKPQHVARPAAKVASAPPAAKALPPAEPAPALRSGAPPIEIARVRPVIVGSRPANPAADEGPRTQPAPDRREGAAAASPWTASSTLAAPAQSPAAASAPSARGASPSTLGDQAASLARGAAPLAAAAPAPAPRRRVETTASTGGAAAGGFQVQIGAFQSQAEAERQLAAVRERAGTVLARSSPVTLQVQQGQKVFYRARYAGFDAPAAAQACNELKRLKVDCLVMKAE
jgi:D-alanyl-D-alanine carboxypeptidase